MAHNEAGLEALLEVARGLTAPGARVHLGSAAPVTARTTRSRGSARSPARAADHVVLAHKPKYVRGRTMEDIDDATCGRARPGGHAVTSSRATTELGGLVAMLPPPGRR